MNFYRPIDVKARPHAVALIASQPNQVSATRQINQTSNTLEGLLVSFLFISYVCAGLFYKKHHEKRTAARLRQIKTLERIWKISPQR